MSWSEMFSWWRGLNKREGFRVPHFTTEMSFASAEHMGLPGLRVVNWLTDRRVIWGYNSKEVKLCVRWHQPQNEKKVSSRVIPDWLLGRCSLISMQLRGKWRVCVFWTVKKITLRRQKSGYMAVYFNYSFQNCNYQMLSFHFLQIRGLSCWTWHREKTKNFTRKIFCLSDNWISSDFFFFWLAFNFFPEIQWYFMYL